MNDVPQTSTAYNKIGWTCVLKILKRFFFNKKNPQKTGVFFIGSIIIIIVIYSLTARVIGTPHMISQPVCSMFSYALWDLANSIPWCCLPTSFTVYLVFLPLSLCLARWFWPDLVNGRHDHTTAVCVSLRCSGGLNMVQLSAGSWRRLPHSSLVRWSLYEMRSILR